ncbi:MAG: hypothetical protein M0D57_01120 [Sphingobacteriales bacterium JAD_PAG50586_3]|nr:MAG: hypothetical protein M0D57_01120 [Sphingobacteriales bacterium JAD_PAG50586_3]
MNKLYILFTCFIVAFIGCQMPHTASFRDCIEKGKKALENHDLDSAIKYFDQAVIIDPKNPEGYYGLGVTNCSYCYNDSTNCDKTLYNLNKVNGISPGYKRTYYNLAVCKMVIGDNKGALIDLNAAIAKDSTDADYYLNRAAIFLRLNDFPNACKDLEKASNLGSATAKVRMETLCK